MEQLSREQVERLTQAFRDRKIVVLGDLMLDEFIWGDVTRISPEAPVPVVEIRRRRCLQVLQNRWGRRRAVSAYRN